MSDTHNAAALSSASDNTPAAAAVSSTYTTLTRHTDVAHTASSSLSTSMTSLATGLPQQQRQQQQQQMAMSSSSNSSSMASAATATTATLAPSPSTLQQQQQQQALLQRQPSLTSSFVDTIKASLVRHALSPDTAAARASHTASIGGNSDAIDALQTHYTAANTAAAAAAAATALAGAGHESEYDSMSSHTVTPLTTPLPAFATTSNATAPTTTTTTAAAAAAALSGLATSLPPFMHEVALLNFRKTFDNVKRHCQCERGADKSSHGGDGDAAVHDGAATQPSSSSSPAQQQQQQQQHDAALLDATPSLERLSNSSANVSAAATEAWAQGGADGDDDNDDKERHLAEALRCVVTAADRIDDTPHSLPLSVKTSTLSPPSPQQQAQQAQAQQQTVTTTTTLPQQQQVSSSAAPPAPPTAPQPPASHRLARARHVTSVHWRDDDDIVVAPSSFFQHSSALVANDSPLREMTDAMGRPVRDDAELHWLLSHSMLFSLLDKAELQQLLPCVLRREYAAGDVIVAERSHLRYVYVVVWGSVEVFHAGGDTLECCTHDDASPSRPSSSMAAAMRDRSSHHHAAWPQDVPPSLYAPAAPPPVAAATSSPAAARGTDEAAATSSAAAALAAAAMQHSKYHYYTDDHHHHDDRHHGHAHGGGGGGSIYDDHGDDDSGESVGDVGRAALHVYRHHRHASGDDDDNGDSSADERGGGEALYTHAATLTPGQTFGAESCVLLEASTHRYCAGAWRAKTVVALVPYHAVQAMLARNVRFAQGVGSAILGTVDVFAPLRQFCRYVFSPMLAQNDYLPLWAIVDQYTRLDNVIHTRVRSRELDTGAWGYALNRLPENITSTFCFDLVHALPPFVASRMRDEARVADVRKLPAERRRARTDIAYVRTKERRRCTWHLGMEGKSLVLLRDGFTDLLDFLTMLCVHIIESHKLRGRVQGMVHPPAIDILDAYLRQRDEEARRGVVVTRDGELARVKAVLQRMPLLEAECVGLLRMWGNDTLLRIYEVMMHREEFNVRVDPSIARKFQVNPFHEWALNLRRCVLEKLGRDRASALPDDLCVDVVSSNTHCIKNLLSSFVRTHRDDILAYAAQHEVNTLGRAADWHNVDDLVYVALPGFLQNARPDLKDDYNSSIEASGITILQDTAMTGLQVDVIPVYQLDLDCIDATVRDTLQRRLHDYTTQYNNDNNNDKKKGAPPPPTWAEYHRPLSASASTSATMTPTSFMSSPAAPSLHRAAAVAAHNEHTDNNNNNNNNNNDHNVNNNNNNNNNEHTLPRRLPHHFIINMDFAFGAQAAGIARAVFSTFGKAVRSVSVMGKAGGLQGKRGDIQLASHVLLSKSSLILEDNQDELRTCRNQDLHAPRLRELAGPDVTVHHGKVLTVTGTMLQNAALLRYYRSVWHCIGTEMEGSYFARVTEDFYRQGIAHAALVTRFAYYTSDLPLAVGDAAAAARAAARRGAAAWRGGAAPAAEAASLSASMTPREGVPPLYAIARGILECILLA